MVCVPRVKELWGYPERPVKRPGEGNQLAGGKQSKRSSVKGLPVIRFVTLETLGASSEDWQ